MSITGPTPILYIPLFFILTETMNLRTEGAFQKKKDNRNISKVYVTNSLVEKLH